MPTERFDTVVIGGGQVGLATGYHLAERGTEFTILDAGPKVGHSWRNRWDSLVLFTPVAFNHLPGMPFPGDDAYLPNKEEMADYLEAYAEKMKLPVQLGVKVQSLSRDGDRYVIDAGPRQFEAKNVVVATGPFQRPRVPDFAAQLDPSTYQVHSSAYKNTSELRDGQTLVVGAATSGSQISMDVAQGGRKVYLSGRDVKSIGGPRIKPKFMRRVIRWAYSRPKNTVIGKKLYRMSRLSGGHPLVGFGYEEVLKTGVERVARTAGVQEGQVRLEDGKLLEVANVIWCTGYHLDFSWIKLPIFQEDGYPRHVRGVVEEEPGLYFLGLVFLHALRSQLVTGAGPDSRWVCDQLVRRSKAGQADARKEGATRAAVSRV